MTADRSGSPARNTGATWRRGSLRPRTLRRISFGSTSAVVTSIGLVVAFASTDAARGTLIGSLLIVGIADNLTDSLSIHLYQEAEDVETHEAFRSTASNFVVRLVLTATFVALALTLSDGWLAGVAVVWGFALLGMLTVELARQRRTSVRRELVRHLAVAAAVVIISKAIGTFIVSRVS